MITCALAVAVVLRADALTGELRRSGDQAELTRALPDAIAAAGGRDRLLACGRPVTGRYRGTMTAWALRVPKRTVATTPGVDGVLLRSRIRRGTSVQPPGSASGRERGRSARWRIEARCPGDPKPTPTVGLS